MMNYELQQPVHVKIEYSVCLFKSICTYRLHSDLTEGILSFRRLIFSETDRDRDIVDNGCSIKDICWHIGVQLESSSSSSL